MTADMTATLESDRARREVGCRPIATFIDADSYMWQRREYGQARPLINTRQTGG
jgi:hypothetical protein